MTFECKRCGIRWNVEGFNREGTFYTLCESCVQEVIDNLALGITKVEIQEARSKK